MDQDSFPSKCLSVTCCHSGGGGEERTRSDVSDSRSFWTMRSMKKSILTCHDLNGEGKRGEGFLPLALVALDTTVNCSGHNRTNDDESLD